MFAACASLVGVVVGSLGAQGGSERGAVTITHGVHGMSNAGRVLMIGAHPDDEDTQLITWLALGRQVETAYLSLTRGDGGQNLIGNELGEALGAIRTDEMLAARRMDGGRQYFTRAYDFGFSKDSAETFLHWPREQTLGDVVRVVRAFRPQVVIGVWSGTPADGHGHHTVSGLLARDAYDLAADTVRFPSKTFGAPWTPVKFYRLRRGAAGAGTLRQNVGEFDPVRGRALGEIAAESRTQHKSQGQGRLAVQGVQWNYLRREASRIARVPAPGEESSLFDGIDTSWTRFTGTTPTQRLLIDSFPVLARAARAALDLRNPASVLPILARAASLLELARNENPCRYSTIVVACSEAALDLGTSIEVAHRRVGAALLAAAGVRIEPFVDRELFAYGDTATVMLSISNRSSVPLTLRSVDVPGAIGPRETVPLVVAADSVVQLTKRIRGLLPSSTAWWIDDRSGFDFFPEVEWAADGARGPARANQVVNASAVAEDAKLTSWVDVRFELAGAVFTHRVGPLAHRRIDAVHGEVRRPMTVVNAVSLLFDRTREFVRANEPVDRVIKLRVRSLSTRKRTVRFQFTIPDGLRADALPDTMTLDSLESRDVPIHVRGRVGKGLFALTAVAHEGSARSYGTGIIPVEYDHIRPIVLTRSSGLWVQGVTVAIPTGVRVVYVPGVSDDAAPVLQQLDIPVTIVESDRFATTDLSGYQVVVLGPRIYAKSPALAEINERLEAFARTGGTVVVQYGQQEMTRAGMLPYRIELAPQPQRVTLEDAPVRIVDPSAAVLRSPNVISNIDFAGWVQERGLYMPVRADSAWKSVLEMNDPGEQPNRNSLLVAKVGQGAYVYTTLSLFRQVPNGVEGAIRLFVNLISAGLRAPSQ